jgi:plasmid stabilization system protein ParE
MKIAYTPRALADIEDIADCLRPRSPQGAVRVRAAILDGLQRLQQFPRIGRLQTVETVRKLMIPRYPYLIYYSIDEDVEEIVVLTIQHSARRREFEDL